ncbi:hypothetical protein C4X99_10570 [Leptospira interrogans serovar Geyaweera]|nr:hypothetical protein C5473_12530 [Leptospira interrogans serovar Weerasinghe]KAA1290760.1 hypothetical protein C4X99_10570 [Leptospira interrogans serovar Geyaweera]
MERLCQKATPKRIVKRIRFFCFKLSRKFKTKSLQLNIFIKTNLKYKEKQIIILYFSPNRCYKFKIIY